MALGVDVRVPSGDAQNFLGSGAAGVKPFGAFSYAAQVSPHAQIGYEWNGKSILAGDMIGPTATNTKGSLPNRFVYIVPLGDHGQRATKNGRRGVARQGCTADRGIVLLLIPLDFGYDSSRTGHAVDCVTIPGAYAEGAAQPAHQVYLSR